jgi:hypothetical protein
MASILKVDTLTGVTTAGSISVTGEGNSTTTNLQQGLAKAWGHFEGSDATLDDSLNTASLTDNGSGNFSPQYTSNMSNTNSASASNGNWSSQVASNSGHKISSFATASCTVITASNGSNADVDDTTYTIFGDLA